MIIARLLSRKRFLLFLGIITLFFYFRNQNIYIVTAYCNCQVCINKHAYRDGRFASNKLTYFGGIAAPKNIKFGTNVKLIPLTEADKKAVNTYLEGKTEYRVEDRGYLIKGNRLDIFIPKRMGGHKTARLWGTRKLKIKFTKTKN
jgi:3D (Asp-Asp-Asp) domain-containing protein